MAKPLGSSTLSLWLIILCTDFATLTDALPNKPYLLYSNLTNFGAIGLNNLSRSDVMVGLRSVVALDWDSVENKIYYGDHSLREMYRVDMDGRNKELLMTNVGMVEGIAVDWVGRSIYWTSYTSEQIEVATLDGKYRKVLINTGLEFARGMALDPGEGFLFWTDWGSSPAVERSTLTGGNRTALITRDIYWPNGITVDYQNKRIYWIDAFHDTISSADYDGGQRTKIFEDRSLDATPYHGFDLDLFGSDVYWTDWLSNTVYGLKQTKPNATIFRNITIPTGRRTKGVMGIVTVDRSRQPRVSSQCSSNNGGCEQLCLLEPNGFKCACKAGFKLAEDGKACRDAFQDEFIMFADGDAGKIYQLEVDNDNPNPVAIKFGKEVNITRPVALDYDPVEDRVYWTDVTLRMICRAFRNGSSFEQIITDKVGVADGLTIDLAGRNLYWTSTTYNITEVSKLDGSNRRVLISSGLHEPRDIVVDPVGGYMYWTDWGFPKIERAFMDGSNRTELVNRSIRWPNGLTIDHVYNKLYWADAYEDSVETYDLITGERTVIINEKILILGFLYRKRNQINHPFGLTLLHENIYWTDWQTNSVYRAEINSGANITLLVSGLDKPMDIHVYSVLPKQQYRKTYTFAFPRNQTAFTCINSRTCPTINAPPPCPRGYMSTREDEACGVYCRDIVGYRYRCRCTNWRECAAKQTYMLGCISNHYASYRVRECVQVVKPGRCPNNITESSRTPECYSDMECNGAEKCCSGMCSKPASVATHPCQKNNGGCDQLCLATPDGYRCQCRNNFNYDENSKKCVEAPPTSTPRPTISTTPGTGCPPLNPPGNGSFSGNCRTSFFSTCSFACKKGFRLKGQETIFCVPGIFWTGSVPTCVVSENPRFTNCPSNISVPTDPGVLTKNVWWPVPTALDWQGNPLNVTVEPAGYAPPVSFRIGSRVVEYTATDRDSLSSTCQFFVEVRDEEPPNFGGTCPPDSTTYVDQQDAESAVTWTEPRPFDNSGEPVTLTVRGDKPGSKYPVGRTRIIYTATDAAGNEAQCSFEVIVINVCTSPCEQKYAPVCGSDGQTYGSLCVLRRARCSDQNITVLRAGTCGCGGNLELSEGFNSSSSIACSLRSNSMECNVTCREGHASVFPEFLKVQCEQNKWIRRNNEGKYVPISDLKNPPRCYQASRQEACTPGSGRSESNLCVLCPPGSFYDASNLKCRVCDVTQYQDAAGQTSCKQCQFPMTSTTTGAESCFFNYAASSVEMVLETKLPQLANVDLQVELSKKLNELCRKTTCSFTDNNSSRKKRASNAINFAKEDVVILSKTTISEGSGTKVELFVLDPTSTELVPSKALSTNDLKSLLQMIAPNIAYPVKSIGDNTIPQQTKSGGGNSKSKAPLIAGVILAILVLFAAAVLAFLYTHRQRQKRRLHEETPEPPVQFTPNGLEGGTQIGYANAVFDENNYETPQPIADGVRHGFVNHVYSEVNGPPPIYSTSPVGATTTTQPMPQARHTYDTPDTLQAGTLPKKEPLPQDAVVELIPAKQVDLPDSKSSKEDLPVKFFHKRNTQNSSEFPQGPFVEDPRYEQPVISEAQLKLEPPPNYDDTKLQLMRENAASSILPNVPRKKRASELHGSANKERNSGNESPERSAVYKVQDATQEQSET